MAKGLRRRWGKREVSVTLKGSTRDPRDVGNVLYLHHVGISVSRLWYCIMALQDVIIAVRSTQDLTVAWESTTIYR